MLHEIFIFVDAGLGKLAAYNFIFCKALFSVMHERIVETLSEAR